MNTAHATLHETDNADDEWRATSIAPQANRGAVVLVHDRFHTARQAQRLAADGTQRNTHKHQHQQEEAAGRQPDCVRVEAAAEAPRWVLQWRRVDVVFVELALGDGRHHCRCAQPLRPRWGRRLSCQRRRQSCSLRQLRGAAPAGTMFVRTAIWDESERAWDGPRAVMVEVRDTLIELDARSVLLAVAKVSLRLRDSLEVDDVRTFECVEVGVHVSVCCRFSSPFDIPEKEHSPQKGER